MAQHNRKISVIGLGYVGLPVAVSFGQNGNDVIAFDIDASRVGELRQGVDRTNEVNSSDLTAAKLRITTEPNDLRQADFHIVTVPTPIDSQNNPDLSPLLSASRAVGEILKRGDIVVYESTVYPGATEEECVPILEGQSGLRLGEDFSVGYSPERINPGDKTHRFETITKVVSGSDEATLETVAEVYGSVVSAGVHRAATIKTAEAAKVIENTQRDLNIALMNELSMICRTLRIDTHDVLEAARTKWNFLPFTPGLVGGHCIGVDPYYLTYKAEQAGYRPEVILAGRQINDSMGMDVAENIIRELLDRDIALEGAVVTILGATFKENVPDVRNSRVVDIVSTLSASGISVQVVDPIADPESVAVENGIELVVEADARLADTVALVVPHECFLENGWAMVRSYLCAEGGTVVDIKSVLPRERKPETVRLLRL